MTEKSGSVGCEFCTVLEDPKCVHRRKGYKIITDIEAKVGHTRSVSHVKAHTHIIFQLRAEEWKNTCLIS